MQIMNKRIMTKIVWMGDSNQKKEKNNEIPIYNFTNIKIKNKKHVWLKSLIIKKSELFGKAL